MKAETVVTAGLPSEAATPRSPGVQPGTMARRLQIHTIQVLLNAVTNGRRPGHPGATVPVHEPVPCWRWGVDPAIQEFVERLGMESQSEDMARTAGRMFAYMLVRGGPCSGDELVARLQISRGGVSMSTRYLEARGLLERTGRPGDQRIYYRLPDDPFGNLVEQSLEHRRRIRDLTHDARVALQDATPDPEFEGCVDRLERMETFYDLVVGRMEKGLRAWRSSVAAATAGRTDEDQRE